jgi:TonB dependent receptor-like, beta-barrel/TonB-dependent Receptor Plug Domain
MRPFAPPVRGARHAARAACLAFALLSGVCAAGTSRASSSVVPTGTLHLTVLDRETGQGVPWANLVNVDGHTGYLADGSGVLRLQVPAGPARYHVHHVSYEESDEILVDVPAGAVVERTVFLVPRAREIPTVEVHADREVSAASEVQGVQTLSVQKTSALPNPTDDVFRTVRMLPGVAAGDVGSRFELRGGGPDQMLVRVDGMELREFFHGRDFGGITSVVPAGAIERVDVYPAGFPARLGGRLSGAVDLDLRSHGPQGVHGDFSGDATSARLLTEVNTKRTAYLVSARQSYLDRILDAIQDDAVVQPTYRDLLVHVVHRPDPTRTISVNYLRSNDAALYRDDVASHFVNADYSDDYLWSTFRLLPSKLLSMDGTIQTAWNRNHREFGVGGLSDESHRRAGARLQVTSAFLPGHLWTAGAQVEREWGRYDFRGADPVVQVAADAATAYDTNGERKFLRVLGATWLQDEWRAADRLTLHLGLRYSRDDGTRRGYLAPRTSAAWEFPGDTTVRAYWGAYEQAPRLVPDATTGEDVIPSELQIAEHRGLGLERRIGSIRFGMDAYEKIFHRLDGVVTRVVDGVEERHAVTHGRSRGVEVSLRRSGEWTNWWVAYTLGRSQWTDGARTYSRDFDRLHALTFANTIRLGDRWDVGLTYAFHTGTPYTEQSWQRVGASDWSMSEGAPNGERLPAYHRLDLRVRRHFRFDTWSLSVYAEALNVTNHPNVLWYGWRLYDDHGPLPKAQRVTRTGIPSVPSVGVEIRF